MPAASEYSRALRRWQRSDPVLARLAKAHPPPPRQLGSGDLFADLCQSLVHQQVSLAAGQAIWSRVEAACGGKVTPAAILKAGPPGLRACGVSGSKSAYLLDLAHRVHGGRLDLEALRGCSDEQAVAELVEVKGIGVWTAKMFLLFALGRPDVVADGDLGLQIAVQRAYKVARARAPGFLRRRAALWSPYGSLASLVLWASRRPPPAPRPPSGAKVRARRGHPGR